MIKKLKQLFHSFFAWIDKLYESGQKSFRRIIVIVSLLFLISIPLSLFKSDNVNEPVIELNLNTDIVEIHKPLDFIQEIQNPNRAWTREQLIQGIRKASKDEKVTTLILNLTAMGRSGLATLSDIGNELENFKKNNKKVIAISNSFNNSQIYLASYADEIILESSGFGQVLITGFGAFKTYYNNLLNSLKLSIHVFKAGKYKSGPETFTRNTMSEQDRVATQYVLKDLWKQYKNTLSSNLEKKDIEIQNFADKADLLAIQYKGDSEKLALESGFVDKILDPISLKNYLIQQFGKHKNTYPRVSFKKYIEANQEAASISNNEIAVIVATGVILDGSQENGSIGSDSLAKTIDSALENPKTKAMVLRIDSPGGSASASEKIRLHLLQAKQKNIPLVISMGNIAASGGYWIASAGDKILASKNTITGSIGAYGMVLTAENMMQNIGVNVDGVGTTKISGAMSIARPLNPLIKTRLDQGLKFTYQRFVNLVSEARDIDLNKTEKIAGGRIWSGKQALKLKLIDQIGSLETAIEEAKKLAKLESYTQKLYQQESRFKFLDILQSSSEIFSKHIYPIQMKPNTFDTLRNLNDPQHIYLSCLVCQELTGF